MAYSPYTSYTNPDGAQAGSPFASGAPLGQSSPNAYQMSSSAPSPYASSAPRPHSSGWGAGIGAGLGVASALGAFGHGSDYGMGQYRGGEESANANQSSLANQYRGLGGQQLDYLGADQNSQRQAIADYANYLRSNPNTDQHNAQFVANQTAGTTGSYLRALSNLKAQSAQMNGGSAGLGSAANSGVQAGLTSLAGQQSGAQAGAQSSLLQNQQADYERRLQALQGLYTGQTGQDYSMGMGALGQAGQGYDRVFNNNAQMWGQAASQAQAQAAQRQSQLQGIGSLASMI